MNTPLLCSETHRTSGFVMRTSIGTAAPMSQKPAPEKQRRKQARARWRKDGTINGGSGYESLVWK